MGILSYRKQTYFISRTRLYVKVLWIFKITEKKKYNWPWKEEKVTVNKRRTKITSRSKCYIYEKRFLKTSANDKSYQKVKTHCHYTKKYRDTEHSICSLKFNVPNEIPVVFHNDSNYDYHFIVKQIWGTN